MSERRGSDPSTTGYDSSTTGRESSAIGEIRRAQEIVATERRRCVDECEAFDAFLGRLDAIAPDVSVAVPAGIAPRTFGTTGGLEAVREAYRETVMSVPHFDHDYGDSLVESVTAEFSADVADALTSPGPLSPPLYATVRSWASRAHSSREAFLDRLDAEADVLADAADRIGRLSDELGSLTDDWPSTPSFDTLFANYESVERLGERADAVVAERQASLREQSVPVHTESVDMATYLYAPESGLSAYPVLAALGTFGSCLDRTRHRIERLLSNPH